MVRVPRNHHFSQGFLLVQLQVKEEVRRLEEDAKEMGKVLFGQFLTSKF